MTQIRPIDPAVRAGWQDAPPRKGFFTDTSVCIGCKACEVACKEWNGVPDDGFDLLGQSYDNTGALGANSWRHVAFIEQPARSADVEQSGIRWLMSSDVCKHCTQAACLDVCPTGSLFRTEFGTVVVQDDICNGCGYCVPACPFGVIGRQTGDAGAPFGPGREQVGASKRGGKTVGIAQKCTLCYDRLGVGQLPACAQACPTQSIQFGDLDILRERAAQRAETLRQSGVESARLYGASDQDGVGGAGAVFLLLDESEVYGLPPDPVVCTRSLPRLWRRAAVAAATLAAGAVAAFVRGQA
jgi:formate dehydrogenase iron-sulfur subunit